MNWIEGILTVVLFLLYLAVWQRKRKELRRAKNVEANVISNANKPIQRYFHNLFKILIPSLVVFVFAHALFKNQYYAVLYLPTLDFLWVKLMGFCIGILGLVISRIAQIALGNSWRVGIDSKASPGLITSGVYSYIRNPTYSGLYIMLFGLLLINPTVLYSYWVLIFFLAMEFQVRCEEEYLEDTYGNEYAAYRKQTKRYLPWLY